MEEGQGIVTSSHSEKPRAFALDDDPEFLEILSVLLDKMGVAIETFNEPKAFLSRLKHEHPRICFVDLHIGGAEVGFAIVQAIRNVLGEDLPLFVVSSSHDSASVSEALESGANDYIHKPVDFKLLATKLSHYLQIRPLSRDLNTVEAVPESLQSAEISAPARVQLVDELGVEILSAHLPTKGTPINIEGDTIQEIFGVSHLTLTVERTELAPGGAGYVVYGEFGSHHPEEVSRNVRKWLALKRG